MRALVQRVARAEVRVDGEVVGRIADGLLVLLGCRSGDGEKEVEALSSKLAHLRIFERSGEGRAGQMNASVLENGGNVLVVPQFTLYADTRRGRRPSFAEAL